MFTIEEFCGHKVSFEETDLCVAIDIWGDAEWIFDPQFGAECYYLWQAYQAKPLGTPVRSRVNTSVAVGATPDKPTTVKAEFVCQEDLDDFKDQVRKMLQKEESYLNYKELREQQEKLEEEHKAQRDEALKKAALDEAEDVLKSNN